MMPRAKGLGNILVGLLVGFQALESQRFVHACANNGQVIATTETSATTTIDS